MPSLRRNVIASYVGQATGVITGIIMLPVFVGYLGPEAFGLVGFFSMLQSWSLLLDMGMTPTLSRELARFTAGAVTHERAAKMIRTLEWIFAGLAVLCASSVILGSGWISQHWLKAKAISQGEIAYCLALMGGMLGMNWLGAIYRAGLVGLERMVLLNIALIISAVGRTGGSWLVLKYVSATPHAYFTFHVIAALVEVIGYRTIFCRVFSLKGAGPWPSFQSMHGARAIAGGMAYLSALWIVVSQSDKLVLSWLLDLSSYGSFAIAASLAGGINQLASPLIQSLQPRFVALAAQGAKEGLEELYRTSTQLMTVGLFAVAGSMACFAGPLLLAWTGNAEVAQRGAPILALYVVGYATSAILSLAFSVQFAFGRLRYHLIGSTVLGLLWIPGGYLAARYAGAVGTGTIWMVCNALYLLTWLSYIHSRILPGLWHRWLLFDVGLVALVEGLLLVGARLVGIPFTGRIPVLGAIGFATVLVAALGLLFAPFARRQAVALIERFRISLSRQST